MRLVTAKGLVPVVHRRDPRGDRSADTSAGGGRRVGGACGPTGASRGGGPGEGKGEFFSPRKLPIFLIFPALLPRFANRLVWCQSEPYLFCLKFKLLRRSNPETGHRKPSFVKFIVTLDAVRDLPKVRANLGTLLVTIQNRECRYGSPCAMIDDRDLLVRLDRYTDEPARTGPKACILRFKSAE